MKIGQAQQIVRKASPSWLACNLYLGKQEALTASIPPKQKELPGPSTLAELAEALRNPLPPSKANGRCYSPLEAMKSWKPLTKEMICDLMAKEAAAREVLMKDYAERTGQQVDYCDYCNLGVREEEVEEEWGTRSEAMPCGNCDGLGIITI